MNAVNQYHPCTEELDWLYGRVIEVKPKGTETPFYISIFFNMSTGDLPARCKVLLFLLHDSTISFFELVLDSSHEQFQCNFWMCELSH